MPHIHDKPGQHDHVIDMFIFRTDFDEPKLMFHMHRKHAKYMQFGGHVELNETPMQAVIHELREESGYDADQLSVLQPKGSMTKSDDMVVHPIPAVYNTHALLNEHFHIGSYYALVTDQPPAHDPEEGESTDIKLFTRQELVDMPDEQVMANARESALFMFDHILKAWEPIPLDQFDH